MKLLKKLYSVFHLGGVTKEEMEQCKADIAATNRYRVIIFSGIALAMMLGLLVAAFFVDAIRENMAIYAVVSGLLIVLNLLELFILNKRPQFSRLFVYAFMVILYGFTIYFGTFYQPDVAATTFCVAILVLPLLFTLTPFHAAMIQLIAIIVFCICAWQAKVPEVASLDMVNAITFCIVGGALNMNIQSVKMREQVQRYFIEHERDTDRITGILNKSAFEMQVRQYFRRPNPRGYFLMIDLDNFKRVNDTYGHDVGDDVIRAVGDCVQRCFRSTDYKGRFGGDEFMLFLPDTQSEEGILSSVNRWMAEVAKIQLPDPEHRLQGSVGIVCAPENGSDYDTLFQKADTALYKAKRSGKNCCCAYKPDN